MLNSILVTVCICVCKCVLVCKWALNRARRETIQWFSSKLAKLCYFISLLSGKIVVNILPRCTVCDCCENYAALSPVRELGKDPASGYMCVCVVCTCRGLRHDQTKHTQVQYAICTPPCPQKMFSPPPSPSPRRVFALYGVSE